MTLYPNKTNKKVNPDYTPPATSANNNAKFKDFDDGLCDVFLENFKKWITSVSYAMMKKRHNPDTDEYRG